MIRESQSETEESQTSQKSGFDGEMTESGQESSSDEEQLATTKQESDPSFS